MGIFGKIVGKLFGSKKSKQEAEQADFQRMQSERAAQVHRDRANRARTEARQQARLANELGRLAQENPRQRQRANEAAARERLLREEAVRQERLSNQARQQARDAQVRLEQIRAQAREALLETRREMTDEEWFDTFQGPRPAKRMYGNVKSGDGDLPDANNFLKLGVPYSAFASSNVMVLQYDPRTGDLYIQYIGNRWYRYPRLGATMAMNLYHSASKGLAVWDSLRIRGTFMGSKVAFEEGVSPPSYLPLDPDSSAAQYGMA